MFSSQLAFNSHSSINTSDSLNSASPPPHSIPSSRAERTAHTESSTLSYFSFCSTSEFPPTYIHPIAPAKLAMLIKKTGKAINLPLQSKFQIANKILSEILNS